MEPGIWYALETEHNPAPEPNSDPSLIVFENTRDDVFVSMVERVGSFRADTICKLGREYANADCGGAAGPKSVAMWSDLAERLCEGIAIGFEEHLRERLTRVLEAVR